HLLFNEAPPALLTKVEQVVRLIRSKGVGVFFITQVPTDIPPTVLAQLGNKIQHALRAYTPNDQKAIKATAGSFRANPAFDAETALTELGTGEALISVLGADGTPTMVERAKVLPPRSFMGVAEDELIAQRVAGNPLNVKYAAAVDNESAYEQLAAVNQQAAEAAAAAKAAEDEAKAQAAAQAKAEKEAEAAQKKAEKMEAQEAARKQRQADQAASRKANTRSRVLTNTLSAAGREAGRQIIRGILGNILK
ncbi:MAG: DUF853 domain-containing protein, partial [Propionibacteriaceae bacterium]|nr:DUF853 domain-containing protein [Propionibacteriaceae bacterium]